MNVYHHRRPDASQVLYIDGNLQFDSRDEAVYHESLALPPLCLAKDPKHVLICGGGDGLVLREVLRFPGIESVTLIDCSPVVLELARTEMRELNQNALADPRVQVVVADALEYPLSTRFFDVIVCDFTFPTTSESARGFTLEWYWKLGLALTESGVMAINAVSPQNTPSAFACLVSTLRTAGFRTLPFRVCIPSFREHGYGAWGFILASVSPLTIDRLSGIECPIPTRQADLGALASGAHFSRACRAAFAAAPVNRNAGLVLSGLLLNPTPMIRTDLDTDPPEFPNLLSEVEILHPYHSRSMIETLAEHVAGSLRSIDLRKLVDELSERAKRLPQKVVEELGRLKEYLTRTVLDLDTWGLWASRLFATLLLVMTIANSISPDPAFAKGAEGLGHASFARGYTGAHTYGLSGPTANAPITGRGFTSSYGRAPVDIYGFHYAPRIYYYGGYGYGGYGGGGYGYGGGYGGSNRNPAPLYQSNAQHKPLFVLDDDLLAMDNGDFVIPLSDTAFLVVADGRITFMDGKGGKPLMPIYAEPKLFEDIRKEVSSQSGDLRTEITNRRDWLAWAGWTSDLFPTVKGDTAEYLNLQDLDRRLKVATKHLGASSESSSLSAPDGAVELFVGCHVLSDNRIAFYAPGGKVSTADGTTLTRPDGKQEPLKPELKAAVVSILTKMLKETRQDIVSNIAQRQSLMQDQAATERDLQEYQSIQNQNFYDPTYEVDYGTDSIPVGQAIQLTQSDLNSITSDEDVLDGQDRRSRAEFERFQSALQAWST